MSNYHASKAVTGVNIKHYNIQMFLESIILILGMFSKKTKLVPKSPLTFRFLFLKLREDLYDNDLSGNTKHLRQNQKET